MSESDRTKPRSYWDNVAASGRENDPDPDKWMGSHYPEPPPAAWQALECNRQPHGLYVDRMAVPGGWIYRFCQRELADSDGALVMKQDVYYQYVPDRRVTWV